MKIHKNKIGFTSRKGEVMIAAFPRHFMEIYNNKYVNFVDVTKEEEKYRNFPTEMKFYNKNIIENWAC